MTYKDFITAFARRLDISADASQHLVDEMCEEVLRQLILGEDVNLPKLGKFQRTVPKLKGRVSNLPGMQGRLSVPTTSKRLKFQPFTQALRRLESTSFVSMVSCSGAIVSKEQSRARKGAEVAKEKKGEHVTIDLPEGVKQVTINVSDSKTKKKKAGESTSKKRLLG